MRITTNIFTLEDLYDPLMDTLGWYKTALCCVGRAGVAWSPKEVIQKNIYFEYLIKQYLSPDKAYIQVFPQSILSGICLRLFPLGPSPS